MKTFNLFFFIFFILSVSYSQRKHSFEIPKNLPQKIEKFLVIGDPRTHGGMDPRVPSPYYLKLITIANKENADFIMIIGDLIRGYTNNVKLLKKEWDAYESATKRFNAPAISLIGNHDISTKIMEDYFIKRFGNRLWQSFSAGGQRLFQERGVRHSQSQKHVLKDQTAL